MIETDAVPAQTQQEKTQRRSGDVFQRRVARPDADVMPRMFILVRFKAIAPDWRYPVHVVARH